MYDTNISMENKRYMVLSHKSEALNKDTKGHGFFKSLLSDSDKGNVLGSAAGATIGFGLAVAGIIGGGFIIAAVTSVVIGAIVGSMLGGMGSAIAKRFHKEKTVEDPAPVVLQPARSIVQTPELAPALMEPAHPVEATPHQDVPLKLRSEGLKNKLKPEHFQSREQGEEFRSSIVKERLNRAMAFHGGIGH